MSWPEGPTSFRNATRIGLVLALVLVPVCAVAETGVSLLVEPGFPTEDGPWLVPIGLVDENGTVLEVPADDLRVALADNPVDGFDLGFFAPEPGGFPSSVAVLVDGGFPAEGIGMLAGFLGSGAATARRGLFKCGSEAVPVLPLGQTAPSAAGLNNLLSGDEPARLWDSILASIAVLGKEGSVRKILVIVSNGKEGLPSEHPLATCVEAALRTRVAVYVVELEGDTSGLARLRELARRTGGTSFTYTGKGSIRRSLAVVDGVRALSVPVQAGQLPVELAVSFGFSAEAAATATIDEPKALSGPGILLLVGLVLGVLLVAAGGVALFRVNARKAGFLLVDFQGKRQELPIFRSGLTIGSDDDNQLVLSDKKISRHHAVIRVRADEVILTDLRSVSGTLVNGHQIRNASLQDGDKILLGGTAELQFRRQTARS